jgi:SacI homology domain
VAIFVECEQIVYYNGYCCSHLQVRGSVPVYSQQRGVTTSTKITRSYDLTNPSFLKHFEGLYSNWGRVLGVNLMAKGKKEDQMITDNYESHVQKNNLSYIRYEYFDFHHACKGQRYDKVNPLLTKLQPMIENFRFYAEDTVIKTIPLTQKVVIRTNCLDCLDRTKLFQGKVAMTIFDAIVNLKSFLIFR